MSGPRLLESLRQEQPAPAAPDGLEGARVLYALRRILRAVDVYALRLAAEHQVTSPQLNVLYAVVDRGPIGAPDLGYAVQMTSSVVLRILERLEAEGFVCRERAGGDPRRLLVTATEAGRELAARTPCSTRHPLRIGLQRLQADDRRRLLELLEQLVKHMDAGHLSTAPVSEGPTFARPGAADLPDRRPGSPEQP